MPKRRRVSHAFEDGEGLELQQRAIAASWEQNNNCLGAAAIAAGEDPGMCMAETVAEYRARKARVKKLVREGVAVSCQHFKELARPESICKPEHYSFRDSQLRIGFANLSKICAELQSTTVPVVSWPSPGCLESARAAVRQEGAVLLQGVRRQEKELLEQGKKYLTWKASQADASFTEYVHETKHRHHLRLQPSENPAVAALFDTLVQVAAGIILPFVSPLGAVVEFAAFLTNPGACGQPFHTDIKDSEQKALAPIYTTFLFLTDVDDESHGPLQIAPRSHALSRVREATRTAALILCEGAPGREVSSLSKWKLLPAKSGDIAIYDGSVLHRGTANNSTRTRCGDCARRFHICY